MKKVAFIGSYDKADMIIYIAKTLVNLGKKVLVVDSTVTQKTRYIVPTMKALKQYITTFEKIDIAIGFENFNQIKEYKGEALDYDFALIDIDSYRGYYYYQIKTEDKKYFITSFDVYCLRRGLQVFKKIEEPIEVTKILFTKEMLPEEDRYLDFLAKGLKVKWAKDILYFPFDLSDQNAIFANQRSGRIQLRGLSIQYIDGISFMAEEISGESSGNIKKAVKMIERN
ncbi:MAG: hypothetical protein IJW20_04195 [Clostridia bacterium]|nr:hypothetical protein [Clostridia bacterium]